jgi:hypothetical protein
MKYRLEKMRTILIKINAFKTRNNQGFVQMELDELMKSYPEFDISKFNKALVTNTAFTVNGELLHFRNDIEKAFLFCMGYKDVSKEAYDGSRLRKFSLWH